jgi:Aspartyl protease
MAPTPCKSCFHVRSVLETPVSVPDASASVSVGCNASRELSPDTTASSVLQSLDAAPAPAPSSLTSSSQGADVSPDPLPASVPVPDAASAKVLRATASRLTKSNLCLVQGHIGGRYAVFLVDSGAGVSYVSDEWLKLHDLKVAHKTSPDRVRLADGSEVASNALLPRPISAWVVIGTTSIYTLLP